MQVNLSELNFQTEPLMAHRIKMQMMENPKFAQMLNINITGTVYEYLAYKVRMAENINIALKGGTRIIAFWSNA